MGGGGGGGLKKRNCVQTSKAVKEFSGGSKVLKLRILFAIFTVGIGYSR